MPNGRSAKLLSSGVYDAIRSDVLAGRREPGSRIKITTVATAFGVSLSVVREALTRLAEQGLLVAEPNQGFCVVPLSLDDLTDLTRVRVHIESLAVSEAIQHGDLAWEAKLIAAHHVLERSPMVAPDDPQRVLESWAAAHHDFHDTLVEGCNSPRLIEITRGLRDAAELYRRWSVPFAPDTSRDIAQEHRSILDAAITRDATATRRLLTEHIEQTTKLLLDAARAKQAQEPLEGGKARRAVQAR